MRCEEVLRLAGWLEKRLTKPRRGEERWIELAQAVETVWELFFDPAHQRLVDLRSAYTAADEDLVRRIQERGDYFNRGYSDLEERSISVPWRRLELEYKDLELILDLAFKRHFGHVEAQWWPLFAPKGQPYGTMFKPSDGLRPETKNAPPEGWWLTSRGMLGIDSSTLWRKDISKDEFKALAIPILLRTKPLHIIFDGIIWYRRHVVPFEDEAGFWNEANRWLETSFGIVGGQFDITAGDVRSLDTGELGWISEVQRTYVLPFMWPLWGLDQYLPIDLANRWGLPLDIAQPGLEGDRGGLWLAHRNHACWWTFRCEPEVSMPAETERAQALRHEDEPHGSGETVREHPAPYQWPWTLDTFLPADLAARWGLQFSGFDRAMPGIECRDSQLWLHGREIRQYQDAPFIVGRVRRYDEIPADDLRADGISTIGWESEAERRHETSCICVPQDTGETVRECAMPYQWPWTLDSYFPADLAARWNLPMDLAAPGIECGGGQIWEPAREAGRFAKVPFRAGRECRYDDVPADARNADGIGTIDCGHEAERALAVPFETGGAPFDYPLFDEIRADFCPLDMALPQSQHQRSFA